VLFSNSYVKGSLGKASIMNFKELPGGMAGVIPLFFVFRAKSNIVNKTSWYLEEGFLLVFMDFTCTSVKFPGAWYFTWSSSACFNPLPFGDYM
jgi:hypothetical protein